MLGLCTNISGPAMAHMLETWVSVQPLSILLKSNLCITIDSQLPIIRNYSRNPGFLRMGYFVSFPAHDVFWTIFL